MLRTLLCEKNNRFLVVEDPEAISEIVQDKGHYLWLDLEQPTLEEFQMLREEFGLHPLAIEDAMKRHQRPKIEQYETFYLVVFYSVVVEEPDRVGTLPGRRGLRGTNFLRPGPTNGYVPPVDVSAGDAVSEVPGQVTFAIPPTQAEPSGERIVLSELTLFLGENYLITVHSHPVAELDEAAMRWRRNVEALTAETAGEEPLPGTRPLTPEEQSNLGMSPHLLGSVPSAHPQVGVPGEPVFAGRDGTNKVGILLYSLLDTVVDGYFPVIDSMVERIEDLEEQVFERFNQGAIEEIFLLKKDLLTLRKVIAPERDVLNILTRRDIAIFDNRTIVYFQDVYDHIVRITDNIDTYRDLLSSALDSYLSMQSNRLNITVQTLTSWSIILMSIAVFTGWYGMNFAAMPELTSSFGYPALFVVVLVVVIIEFIFFKRKGWL